MSFIDKTYFKSELLIPGLEGDAVVAKLNDFIKIREEEYLKLVLGKNLYKEFIEALQQPAPDQKWIDLLYGAEFDDMFDQDSDWIGLVALTADSIINSYYPADIEITIDQTMETNQQITNAAFNKKFRLVKRGIGTIASNEYTLTGVTLSNFTQPLEIGQKFFVEFLEPVLVTNPGVVDDQAKKSPIANYIYYWYMRNEATNSTGTGEKKTNAKNASNSNSSVKQARAWNQMVEWNRLLRRFLLSKSDIYTSYIDPYMKQGQFERKNLFAIINSIF